MSEEQANEMIEKICAWLRAGAPGIKRDYIQESIPADIARDMCHALLDASGAERDGGCPLCGD